MGHGCEAGDHEPGFCGQDNKLVKHVQAGLTCPETSDMRSLVLSMCSVEGATVVAY